MLQRLLILQWNIQGCGNKRNLLHEAARGEGVDVFLLQETLTPEERPISLRGYKTFAIPRVLGATQGQAILVKNSIPSIPIADPAYCGDHVDVQGVTLTLANTTLDVYNIHNRTQGNLNIEDLLAHAAETPTFIGGNFNCHHPLLKTGDTTNTDGRHLARVLYEHPDVRLLNNGQVTHLRGGVLDLSLISATLAPLASWSLHPNLTSDHFAVRCALDVATLPAPPPPPPRFLTKKADWPRFAAFLANFLQSAQPPQDNLDEMEEATAQAFYKAAEDAIPISSKPRRQFRDYWFRDERVTEMNARLNATRKLFRRWPTEANKATLKAVLQHTITVKAEVREAKWLEWCRSLDSHSSLGAMWRKLRAIRGMKPPTPQTHPDPEVEAERLAAHFAGRTSADNLTGATRRKLDELSPAREEATTRACEEEAATDTPIVLHELNSALKSGSSDTSPGDDGITHSMISHAGEAGHEALLKLFNASLEECRLPARWKTANIVPIPKPKDPGSFRPISLLSCVSKTMERIVQNRLQWVTGPLHPAVYAYTKGTGTAECLSTLLAKVSNGKSTAVFLDLEKAFELANETVILSLLAAKGAKGHLLGWIRDFLTGRQARVRFQGRGSSPHQHEHGTPQGSVLSPFLFNVLVEDLLTLPLPRNSSLIVYADDITLVCTGCNHRAAAQRSLSLLDAKCRELGLKLNLNKTKAMLFGGRKPDHPLATGGHDVDWVKEHQYLGVLLDSQLTLRKHVNKLQDRVLARTNVLRSMTRHSDGASFAVRRAFYTHAIRSIIDYSSPCLVLASTAAIGRLEKLQNKSLRLILSAYDWTKLINLRLEARIPSIESRIKTLTASLVAKMAHSPRPSTPPEKVFAAADRDPTLFNDRTWARKAAAALVDTKMATCIREKGTDTPHPDYSPPPPWRPLLPSIKYDWLKHPKSAYHPQALQAESLNHLRPLSEEHEVTIYTDGSVEQDTGAAGAAMVCGEVTRQWRVSDGASSLQTELVAIKGALNHALEVRPRSVLVATDSKASLQALKHPQPSDNISLLTCIFSLAQNLQELGTSITLLWIPGHATIRGNERADRAAREASSRPNIDVNVPPSLAQVKSLTRQNMRETALQWHADEVARGSQSATWYREATSLRPLAVPASTNSRIRADLHRLRLGYPCHEEIKRQLHSCQHCEEESGTPLLHYLLECPATAGIRNRNYDVNDDEANSVAARLVAATSLPRLLQLVQRAPPPR